MFDILLTLDSSRNIKVLFAINKTMNTVFFRKTLQYPVSMFKPSANEIVRHTGVERAIAF